VSSAGRPTDASRRAFCAFTASALAVPFTGAHAASSTAPSNARSNTPSNAPSTSARPRPRALEVGVCASAERAEVLARAGADFVEIACQRELAGEWSDEVRARRLAALTALAVPARCANAFLPGRLACTGPDADHDAVLAEAERLFERAAAIGLDTITFGSAGARTPPDDFPRADAELQFVALLARLAAPAERHGVIVCLEPLRRAETPFVNRVSEGLRLVRAVDHPRVRLTADLFHMAEEEEDASVLTEAAPFVHHLHAAEREGRAAPGTRGDDFGRAFALLLDAGFCGRVSVECRFTDFEEQAPRAIAVLREQLARAGGER